MPLGPEWGSICLVAPFSTSPPGEGERGIQHESKRAFSSCLDRQVAEKVDISNLTGPVLMNRRNEMGGVRIVRQQYRRWGGNS